MQPLLARECLGRDRTQCELAEQEGDPADHERRDPDRQGGGDRALGLQQHRQQREQHGRAQPEPGLDPRQEPRDAESDESLLLVGLAVLDRPPQRPQGSGRAPAGADEHRDAHVDGHADGEREHRPALGRRARDDQAGQHEHEAGADQVGADEQDGQQDLDADPQVSRALAEPGRAGPSRRPAPRCLPRCPPRASDAPVVRVVATEHASLRWDSGRVPVSGPRADGRSAPCRSGRRR